MLDEYGLRLLGELGVDVYVPRAQATAPAETAKRVEAAPRELPRAQTGDDSLPAAAAVSIGPNAVCVVGEGVGERLLDHLMRTLAALGLDAVQVGVDAVESLGTARGLVVFGESSARGIGARLPAQSQVAMHWVVAAEPAQLRAQAPAKQALWGELKRLAASLRGS